MILDLDAIAVEKPWGIDDIDRHVPLGAMLAGKRIGELIYGHDALDDPALLIKLLFTSERLSIQTHPDDAQARAAGMARGKDEAWIVLDAGPDATIGLGLTRMSDTDELRKAALDGSIEALIDWKPVATGDVFYAPAGTVHAIGKNLVLIEVQQNTDCTYRLYDYGRPRPLQLDDGLHSALMGPHAGKSAIADDGSGTRHLIDARAFSIDEHRGADRIVQADASPGNPIWLALIDGQARLKNVDYAAFSIIYADEPVAVQLHDATSRLLIIRTNTQ